MHKVACDLSQMCASFIQSSVRFAHVDFPDHLVQPITNHNCRVAQWVFRCHACWNWRQHCPWGIVAELNHRESLLGPFGYNAVDACWNQAYADAAGSGNGWVVGLTTGTTPWQKTKAIEFAASNTITAPSGWPSFAVGNFRCTSI